MTLAELRRVNTQLDTECFTEKEALRTEYLSMLAKCNDEKEAAESDYERKVAALTEKNRLQMDALDDAYRKFGAHIGALMDRRRFCETQEDVDKLRQQIDDAMDRRQELRTQRRALNENIRKALYDLKEEHRDGKKALHQERVKIQREFRNQKLAIGKKYADLHEDVRKVIAVRKAEEREQETASAEI